MRADAAEEEGDSDHEDIFELEGQTEQLHIGTPGAPDQDAAAAEERARSRGGWEGAACGAYIRIRVTRPPCTGFLSVCSPCCRVRMDANMFRAASSAQFLHPGGAAAGAVCGMRCPLWEPEDGC